MLYKDLGLKVNDEVKTISIQGKQINIFKYLPIHQKNDLVQIALQNARENGVINDVKLEVYFNMYIVFLYTDLVFTDEEKQDLEQLYDELQSSGILTRIIGAIDEYDTLFEYLEIMRDTQDKYETSAAGLIKQLTQDLPQTAAIAAEQLKDFNPEKFQQVMAFTQAANAGQPIPLVKEN